MSEYFDNKQLFASPKTTQYGSHMVMTEVNKPTKTKIVNIDTRFRDEYNYLNNSTTPINYNYNNAASYTITLPERYTEVKSMKVTNVELPMSFYNISKELGNNYFSIKNNSTSAVTTVTLANGQYTTSTIAAEINSDLSSNSITTLNFSINTAGFATIAASGASPGYTLIFNYDSLQNVDKNNFKSKLGWLLGFRNISYSVTAGNPVTSEAFVDLNTPKYVYLVVDEHSNGKQNSFVAPLSSSMIQKNILARISMDYQKYPFRSTLAADESGGGLLKSDERSYTGKTDIQRLVIQLINENGALLNLNGLDFSFCLEFQHE